MPKPPRYHGMMCRYINGHEIALELWNFPPWQPSIARISEFTKNHWSRLYFQSLQELDGFLERTGNDRSSALVVVGSLLLFKTIENYGYLPKTRSSIFCGYESLASHLANHDGSVPISNNHPTLVITGVEWVPEWEPWYIDAGYIPIPVSKNRTG